MTACGTTVKLSRTLLLGLAVVLCAAQMVYGQRRVPRSRGPSQPRPEVRQPRSGADADGDLESGVCQGRISKFDTRDLDSSDNEDLIGLLKIRPSQPGARTLKLEVTDNADVSVSLARHHFDPFEYEDILTKGFFCSVRWAIARSDEEQNGKVRRTRTAPKALRSLELETLTVEGKIDEIGDDYIVLARARPKDGRQWPDVAAYLARTGRTADSQKTSRPVRKKLELSFVEPITSFVDAAGETLYLSDFSEGEEVEAVLAYGGKRGLLVELRSAITYGDAADDETPARTQQPRNFSARSRR